MTKNTMLETLASGGTALGAWMFLREPLIVSAAAQMEYDDVCIDMQHGHQDDRDVTAVLSAAAAGGVTPIVRTPWNGPGMIACPICRSPWASARASTTDFGPVTAALRTDLAAARAATTK